MRQTLILQPEHYGQPTVTLARSLPRTPAIGLRLTTVHRSLFASEKDRVKTCFTSHESPVSHRSQVHTSHTGRAAMDPCSYPRLSACICVYDWRWSQKMTEATDKHR